MEIGVNIVEPGSAAKPFHCTICPKSFIHKSSLEEHILSKHVDDKEFQCSACLETKQLVKFFATQHILNKHMKRVHGPPRFKCHVCFKTFKDSSQFAAHKRIHSNATIKEHKCALCPAAYRFKSKLQTHLFNVHKQKRGDVSYFKCELCSYEFVRKSELELHVVRQHVVDKAFECPVCSKTFIDQQTLEKHMKRHDRQKEYFCDVCSQGFKVKNNLVIHLGVKHNHFFYCDKKCLRSFKNKPDFDAHNSDSKQELKCYICQELFNSECNLKIHTDSHVKETKTEIKNNKIEDRINPLEADTKVTLKSTKELNSENFECDLCAKTFDREAYLRAHRNRAHPNAEWKCNFEGCFKTFKIYSYLRLHKMMHADTKEFVCNICGKSFYRPDSLKDHERMHIKDKKYRCEICPKSFTGSSALQSHIGNNHGGPRPFKCPVVNCGTFWAVNSQLNVHLISHQTDKSIKCELCATFKAFKSPGQLAIHQRRVHSEKKKNKAFKNRTFKKNTKFLENVVFICSSSACSFDTVNEKNVALHYNQQHGLPKVLLLRNIGSPAAMSKEPQEMRSMIRKQYKCDICFKLLKTAASFSSHQAVHLNAIPVKCPVCSSLFKFKKNLKRHAKNCHNNKSTANY